MNLYTIDNFIYRKDNALPKEDCENIIKDGLVYVNLNSEQLAYGQHQYIHKALGRDDFQLFMPRVLDQWYTPIQQCIFKGLDEYSSQVSSCAHLKILAPTCKWQMTKIGGGGFSMWHIEQNSGLSSARVLGWSIYLNDVENGGETEFLYQRIKLKPKAGSLLIWPAGVTHPHRGNPPYSNDKFIVTGWFEFPNNNVYDHLMTISAPEY